MPSAISTLLSLLWVLVWVLVIIVLAYLFTKYIAGRGKLRGFGMEKSQAIEVLARVSVGRDGQLLLVQVGKRYFLLSQTTAGIANLAEFTEEEAADWKSKEDSSAGGDPPPSFGEALKKAWKQVTKR